MTYAYILTLYKTILVYGYTVYYIYIYYYIQFSQIPKVGLLIGCTPRQPEESIGKIY